MNRTALRFECLAPGGNYVWFVRAVFREEEGEAEQAGAPLEARDEALG